MLLTEPGEIGRFDEEHVKLYANCVQPCKRPAMLQRLQAAVIANANVFEVLMDAVRGCSLGQITNALFEVGGQYRRSM